MNDDTRLSMAGATRSARNGRLAAATQSRPGAAGDRLRKRWKPAGGADPTGPTDQGVDAPRGRFLDAPAGQARGGLRFKVYVPSGFTGAPLPLVVMLHGGTQGTDDFAAGTRMNATAEREGFLVVYPEQSTRANSMKYWNWFEGDNQRRGAGEAGVIAGITADVMRRYPVDPGRVYVAGFSAGGAMAAVMAATYPDVYAAAGVHSGLAYGGAHDVASAFTAMKQGPARDVRLSGAAIPLIVFHGDRDQTVDHVNGDRLVDQWRSAAAGEAGGAVRAAPSVHRAPVPGGRSYTRSAYLDARGDSVMEQWVVHGAGHAWSGGGADGSYTDPLGPDASAEMARFFRDHRREAGARLPRHG